MGESKARRTVLILDDDIGFAFWLAQILDKAQYDAFLAQSCEGATELLAQLQNPVDVLVMGFPSADAVAFAGALRRSQRQLKLLAAVGEAGGPVPRSLKVDAVLYKPSAARRGSKLEWLRTVNGLLSRDGRTRQATTSK